MDFMLPQLVHKAGHVVGLVRTESDPAPAWDLTQKLERFPSWRAARPDPSWTGGCRCCASPRGSSRSDCQVHCEVLVHGPVRLVRRRGGGVDFACASTDAARRRPSPHRLRQDGGGVEGAGQGALKLTFRIPGPLLSFTGGRHVVEAEAAASEATASATPEACRRRSETTRRSRSSRPWAEGA